MTGSCRRVARLLVRVFFRRIDIEGVSHVPAGRPLVLVANHVNGLVDGLVLMAMLPRYPRFLGKSTLFKIVPLAPFLHLAGVVPVHRAADATDASGRRGQDRNDAAFRTSRALLAERGLVALFPEGISHDEARLQPLRTGAARIALGAAFDDGVPDLASVAVGLIYDDKARFRSQALVRIGAADQRRTVGPRLPARSGGLFGPSRSTGHSSPRWSRCTRPARTSWRSGAWPAFSPRTRPTG